MATLGPISCVTIATSDLQRMIDTYALYLGYELMDSGKVPSEMAAIWDRPSLAGRRFALMLPGGDGRTYIRFVESRTAADYLPFKHFGWNAAELMVQDTDAAAEKLADSPFKIIGPPADLSFSDKIRAMQVVGPAGESLYLTSFKERLPEFDTPEARHFIDRVFIVILGVESAAGLNSAYTELFGLPSASVIPGVISVISQAHGLPAETQHELAAITLEGQSFLEVDTMPSTSLPRPELAGELPAAISMVTFGTDSLEPLLDRLRTPPRSIALPPYYGRRAGLLEGSAGEWIELVEN